MMSAGRKGWRGVGAGGEGEVVSGAWARMQDWDVGDLSCRGSCTLHKGMEERQAMSCLLDLKQSNVLAGTS